VSLALMRKPEEMVYHKEAYIIISLRGIFNRVRISSVLTTEDTLTAALVPAELGANVFNSNVIWSISTSTLGAFS
jgi:hypothetical protein